MQAPLAVHAFSRFNHRLFRGFVTGRKTARHLFSNFIAPAGDTRANCGQAGRRLGIELIFHNISYSLHDVFRCAAPSRMRESDHPLFRIDDIHWKAIGELQNKKHARHMSHKRIRARRQSAGLRRLSNHGYAAPMHLLGKGALLRREAHRFSQPPTIIGDDFGIVAAVQADIERIIRRMPKSAVTRRESLRNAWN